MTALTAERQSPFQMQSLRNPFERVLPAVERFRNQVVAGVREAGNNIAQRIQRSQVATIDSSRMTSPEYVRRVQDAAQLERARATIATEAHKPSIKKAIFHNAVEATKNSAPAVVVGAGARLALGAGLGLQTLAVAAGASAVSRGVREATFTIRKGAFGETTKLITKHEEGTTLRNFDGSERVARTGLRAKQDQFAQTSVGRVANAMLHGGEKKIAEFAYGKHRHERALINAQYKEVSYLSDKELIKLREHAVMARITNGTASDVYATRQLAKMTYQSVNRELTKRGINRRKAHELQLKLYKKDALAGMAINIVGQAGLAAVKAIPKTFATFFITDAFLKAIHVDTSNRHNPLEGFENTRLGRAIGSAIAPKSVASAEELSPGMPHITQPVSISVISDQTTEAQRFGPPDPRLTTTVHIENGETIIESRGVLASETPKPVMPAPVEAPREPSFVRAPVADRVAIASEVNVVAPMREVARNVQEIQEYSIEGKVSWTQDIFDRKLLSGMQESAHSMEWYGAPGTAERMVKEVFAVNPDLMDADDMQEMQEYLATHPNASFVQMWKDLQHTVFSDDMDKLTDGTAYKVLAEHTVVMQDPIAEVNEEDAIVMGARRASKPPGLAKLAQSTDQQAAPPPPVQTYTRNGVPIQNISLNQGVGNSASQAIDQSGSALPVTSNGIPVQRIDTQATSIATPSGIPIQNLQGPEGAPSNIALDGRIPVQKITLTMSTSGFPDNSIPTQTLSLNDTAYQGTTSNGIPIQRISLDQHNASSSDTRIPVQRLNGIPRSGEAVPVQQITLDPIGSYQEAEGYYDSSVSTHTPFYDYFDGRNGDTTVQNVVSRYDARFGMFESTTQWNTLHFKLNDVNDPYLAPNDVLCASGYDGSTVCGMHSGTNSAGFLPEEFARRHYQVADVPSQMRSDTFRSGAQILQMAAEEAQFGYTREFDLGGGVKVTYKLMETALISSEEAARFTESPTMINLGEHGALVTYYCTHGSIRAWDTFISLYQNLQANGTTIPSDVQEAYAIMQRQASEAEIDQAAQIVKNYLQNNHPNAYQEFMRWYKLAITEEEQQQGALVQKWMPVTGR